MSNQSGRLNLSASKALLHVRKRIAAGGFVGEVRLIVAPGGEVTHIKWLDEAGPELAPEKESDL